jgi:DNA helicase-2/ATP-dependent DNA helicase PcrA
LTDTLIIAGAGAGKSTTIVEKALAEAEDQRKVLLLTYTEGNQSALLEKVCAQTQVKPASIRIKGWFTFLLEDLIRPYQNIVFPSRIANILFDDSDPHWRGKFRVKGRAEKLAGGALNPKHYLTSCQTRVHTTYISKLASRISEVTDGASIERIASIYRLILIDEVQDLVGWDYEIIKALASRDDIDIICVGDFRQTLYKTSHARKAPSGIDEKLAAFANYGFEIQHISSNRRSIQEICSFSDKIHEGVMQLEPSESLAEPVPQEFSDHLGVFAVRSGDVQAYLERYDPVILRRTRSTELELCQGRQALNYGESKGMGFPRVLVLTTDKYRGFLSGKTAVFDGDKTDKARNTFYVISTRARYSVAFVCDEEEVLDGVEVWSP